VWWCICIFGSLYYMRWLRVHADLELKGMDIFKHGESAYPAEAWVEYQYNRKASTSNSATKPSHMAGIGENQKTAAHNNPMEMLPTTGALFSGFSNVARQVSETSAASSSEEKRDAEKGQDNVSFSHQ